MAGNVLVISRSDFSKDPRPNRMINALSKSFSVQYAGTKPMAGSNLPFICLPYRVHRRAPFRNRLRKLSRLASLVADKCDEVFWRDPLTVDSMKALQGCQADVAWVHDLDLLPIVQRLPGIGKVAFDAHEYFPAQYEESFLWRMGEQRLQRHLVQTYVPHSDIVTTVSPGVASRYQADCRVIPSLVLSLPKYENLTPVEPRDDGTLRIIYHGKANENRKIEDLIRLMSLLDNRFRLSLALVGGSSVYRSMLERLASNSKNIEIIPPFSHDRIVTSTNDFDIGLCAIPPTTSNLRHSLPNKLFEMIQARLAIVAWPCPDMARLIEEHGVGVVADDFTVESLASTLSQLTTSSVMELKRRSHSAAFALSYETSARLMQEATDSLLDKTATAA